MTCLTTQSTGSKPFSLLIRVNATNSPFAKSLYSFIDDLTQNLFKITVQECEKSTSGPVDVRCSTETSLLKLPNYDAGTRKCSSRDT